PRGLADAAPLGEVLQDRFGLAGWEPGVEQRRPLALGEPALTGAAAGHAAGLVGAVATGHRQVSRAPLAVVGAVGIQAAEPREVVHGGVPERVSSREGGTSDLLNRYRGGPPNCNTIKPQGNFGNGFVPGGRHGEGRRAGWPGQSATCPGRADLGIPGHDALWPRLPRAPRALGARK